MTHGGTVEGAELWFTSLKTAAKHTFVTSGELQPHAFLLARVHPETKKRLSRPEPFAVLVNFDTFNSHVRTAFINLVRLQARALDAVGVAFLQEMWGTWDMEPELQARAAAHVEAGGSLEDFEERREYVTVIIEHGCVGQRVYYARIERDDDGVSLGEWERLTGNIWGGKLMNVLPPSAYGATGPVGHA